MAKKKLHIHIGPHKTGSTAIQRALRENSDVLVAQSNLSYIAGPEIAQSAKLMNRDNLDAAQEILGEIAEKCARAAGDCLISCEDLAGELPGRTRKRRPYPRLWRNLNALLSAFSDFDCRFYFFIRDPQDWTKSAYLQNLKYRQKFKELSEFQDFLRGEELWDTVVAKSRAKLGTSLVLIDYPSDKKQSSAQCFLQAIPGFAQQAVTLAPEKRTNVAPDENQVRIMEKINRSGASQEAKRYAKLSLTACDDADPAPDLTHEFPAWYVPPQRPDSLPKELEALWHRVEDRIRTQDQPNLLPDALADLRPLRQKITEGEDSLPSGGRRKMSNQINILKYRFRGYPETCFLLGLTISYLRRDTPHTAHAAFLFQRLWAEEYALLLGLLPTRWLISSFQTFLDHGANENQRIIGSGAYFLTNILKAYEAERALEGLPADAIYPHDHPQTKMGFQGMDRFKLGGTDLILNTNALLLELSSKDEIAGRVLREFLVRAKASQSIFSRMDKSRQAHGIDIRQFSNCWSFFEEP